MKERESEKETAERESERKKKREKKKTVIHRSFSALHESPSSEFSECTDAVISQRKSDH